MAKGRPSKVNSPRRIRKGEPGYGKKKFVGDYLEGVPDGPWTGFYPNGQKKYEGSYKFGFQVGKWVYFNKKGTKRLEEDYFVCDEECDKTHPSLGKIINSEKF